MKQNLVKTLKVWNKILAVIQHPSCSYQMVKRTNELGNDTPQSKVFFVFNHYLIFFQNE